MDLLNFNCSTGLAWFSKQCLSDESQIKDEYKEDREAAGMKIASLLSTTVEVWPSLVMCNICKIRRQAKHQIRLKRSDRVSWAGGNRTTQR